MTAENPRLTIIAEKTANPDTMGIEASPTARMYGRPRNRTVRRGRDHGMTDLPNEHAMAIAARASVAVTAVTAVVAFGLRPAVSDIRSFEAGYQAASNPTDVRSALSDGRMNSASFCEDVLYRVIDDGRPSGLRHSDFLRGCRHAVADAME